MTLKDRTTIDGWNLHINILFGFNVSGPDEEDSHSDCMILPRKQDSRAATTESDISIQNDKALYSKCSYKGAARGK